MADKNYKELADRINQTISKKKHELLFYENGYDGRPLFAFRRKEPQYGIKYVYYQCHNEQDAAIEVKRILEEEK